MARLHAAIAMLPDTLRQTCTSSANRRADIGAAATDTAAIDAAPQSSQMRRDRVIFGMCHFARLRKRPGLSLRRSKRFECGGGRADEVEGRNPPIELRVGAIRFAIAPYGIIL